MSLENLSVTDNTSAGVDPAVKEAVMPKQDAVNYQVFDVTDPKNIFPVTYSMSLIEAEVSVQKTLADPFHGVIIQPEQDGTVHGEYNGKPISLRPMPEDPKATVQLLIK